MRRGAIGALNGARLGVDKMSWSVTPAGFEHGGKAVAIGADAADGIIVEAEGAR
jgi:hypothetical protein